ncbi:MAG TPA: MFS transporter [Acidimicrobiales bacterium]|nr:MFS transporter [Acidimicrobiales bacterium]
MIAIVTGGALPAFLTGGVSVQLRAELGFGESGLGLAVGAFFAAAALSSALLGRTTERLGPSASMRVSAASSVVALLGVATAARSFTTLVVWLAVGGVANALAQPAANLFIATTVPPSRLGTAFAVKQSGIPAATLLGGLAVPTIALTVGWRWAFVAGAVLPVVGGLTLPGTGHRRPSAADARKQRAAVPLRPLVVLALGIGFGAAAAGTLGAFLVNAAVHAGIDEGPAGILVSVGSAIGIAVRLVAGHRADRRGGGHLRVVSTMLVAGAVAYGLYATQVPWVLVLATPLAFGAGWGWPGLFNLAVVRAHPSAPGAASGITQTGTYAGAVVGPVAFGIVVEAAGYRTAWLLASAFALAGAGTIAAGRALVRRERLRRDELDEAAAPADPL